MVEGFSIDTCAVYDDSSLQMCLGISVDSLAGARKSGDLKFSRKGRRILYLGQWILDWLEADAETASVRLSKEARTS